MKNDIHRLRLTLSEKRLSHLIEVADKQMEKCPVVDAFCEEELDNLKKQVEYMGMYAFGDKKDPYRQQVFDDLVARLQRLTRDIVKCTRVELSAELRLMKKRSPEVDFELPSIRRNLEDYVSSLTMASITGENKTDIISRHFAYIERLFDYIVTGRLWNETKRKFFSEILSSTVIDTNDQLVLISALTVSTLLVSDEYKIETMFDVYCESKDSEIRGRALVGWVLALHSIGGISEKLNERIKTIVKNSKVMEELLELQIQIFYCAEAENVVDEIKRDVMSGLMNNSNLKINRFGIIDTEDDDMKNLINGSGESDRVMEEMEKSMDKIKNLESKGVDIYFGGFAKMKNYGFFHSMVNWFYPFISKHPDIVSLLSKSESVNLFQLANNCPFCNSDKYSFVFVLSEMYQSMSAEVKQFFNGDGMGLTFKDKGYETPSFKRRMYLQDMYRFFKLNSSSKSLDDPFKEENGLLRGFFFDDYFLLVDEMVQSKHALARFLVKKRISCEELGLLFDSYESSEKNDRLLRAGYLMQRQDTAAVKAALDIYRELYVDEPENTSVLHGLTRCLSHLGKYDEACRYSEALVNISPDSKKDQLNYAIILVKCERLQEADKILFKLNYEHPEDRNVMRVLAWCLLMEGKGEKSIEMFDKIMNGDKLTPADYLNAGFSKWIYGSKSEAADLFAKYVKSENLHKLTHEIDDERALLNKHDIMEVDMCMMLDLVEVRTKKS